MSNSDRPGYCVSCDALSDEELCVKCDKEDADDVNRLLSMEAELSHQREINKCQAARITHLEVLLAGSGSDMEVLQNIYARTRGLLSGSNTKGR